MSEQEKRNLNEEDVNAVSGGYTRVGNHISLTEEENDLINHYKIGLKRRGSRSHKYVKRNADRVEGILKGAGYQNGNMKNEKI